MYNKSWFLAESTKKSKHFKAATGIAETGNKKSLQRFEYWSEATVLVSSKTALQAIVELFDGIQPGSVTYSFLFLSLVIRDRYFWK